MKADVVVLGAGMVGISVALHLQKRGREVVLLDRRGPAEETSYGNTGIIQREAVVPYMFPRDLGLLLRYALNRSTEARYQLSSLPRIAPWLFHYWRASTPERKAASARAMLPLVEQCLAEHEPLLIEAGIADMMRRTGYIRAYRTQQAFEEGLREDEQEKRQYGVNFRQLGRAELAALEPHLSDRYVGAVHMPDPVTLPDPGGVGKAYAELFVRKGGKLLEGEAKSIEAADSGGWRVATRTGWLEVREAVVALGPWSDDVTRKLGMRLPLGWKRGYHMHYQAEGNAVLNHPVIDAAYGFALAPMKRGIRLTTGAEFATRDAPKTPVQIERVEPIGRDVFPLGARIDSEPWLGRRPCFPDMVPAIGPAPGRKGLWLAFGHHHLGFTLGPATGRLIAEMMTGEATFTDPVPYRAERFA